MQYKRNLNKRTSSQVSSKKKIFLAFVTYDNISVLTGKLSISSSWHISPGAIGIENNPRPPFAQTKRERVDMKKCIQNKIKKNKK